MEVYADNTIHVHMHANYNYSKPPIVDPLR